MNSFLGLTNDYLIETQRLPQERDPLNFWPSEATAVVNGSLWGWGCHRKAFWSIKGYPYTNRTSLTTIRAQLLGKAFEEKEIESLVANPRITEVFPNYKFKGELAPGVPISGEMDAIVNINGSLKGIEFKSGHGDFYRREVFGTTYQPGFPKDNYIMQTMIYLKIMQTHKDFAGRINEIEIYCIDRDKCETGSHFIALDINDYPIINGRLYSAINIKDIADRFRKLAYHVKNDKLPLGDFNSYYNIDEMEHMYKTKQIKKWQYDRWKAAGSGCDIQCVYCNYLHRCQVQNGKRDGFVEIL